MLHQTYTRYVLTIIREASSQHYATNSFGGIKGFIWIFNFVGDQSP